MKFSRLSDYGTVHSGWYGSNGRINRVLDTIECPEGRKCAVAEGVMSETECKNTLFQNLPDTLGRWYQWFPIAACKTCGGNDFVPCAGFLENGNDVAGLEPGEMTQEEAHEKCFENEDSGGITANTPDASGTSKWYFKNNNGKLCNAHGTGWVSYTKNGRSSAQASEYKSTSVCVLQTSDIDMKEEYKQDVIANAGYGDYFNLDGTLSSVNNKTSSLKGCNVSKDFVCLDYVQGSKPTWNACPYQMPGNWRWIPVYDDNGHVTTCNPPRDGALNYDKTLRYTSKDYLYSTDQMGKVDAWDALFCPAGTHMNYTTNKCECPDNHMYKDGKCTNVCAPGYGGTVCKPCNYNEYGADGKTCKTCPLTTSSNGKTVSVVSGMGSSNCSVCPYSKSGSGEREYVSGRELYDKWHPICLKASEESDAHEHYTWLVDHMDDSDIPKELKLCKSMTINLKNSNKCFHKDDKDFKHMQGIINKVLSNNHALVDKVEYCDSSDIWHKLVCASDSGLQATEEGIVDAYNFLGGLVGVPNLGGYLEDLWDGLEGAAKALWKDTAVKLVYDAFSDVVKGVETGSFNFDNVKTDAEDMGKFWKDVGESALKTLTKGPEAAFDGLMCEGKTLGHSISTGKFDLDDLDAIALGQACAQMGIGDDKFNIQHKLDVESEISEYICEDVLKPITKEIVGGMCEAAGPLEPICSPVVEEVLETACEKIMNDVLDEMRAESKTINNVSEVIQQFMCKINYKVLTTVCGGVIKNCGDMSVGEIAGKKQTLKGTVDMIRKCEHQTIRDQN